MYTVSAILLETAYIFFGCYKFASTHHILCVLILSGSFPSLHAEDLHLQCGITCLCLYITLAVDGLGCLRWHLYVCQKQKKKKALKPDSHADAVLALSWNRDYRNVLASGSADTTVKVWDLATEQCSATLDYHQDKVQAVAWNPAQASVLLSGGFDKAVCLVRLIS